MPSKSHRNRNAERTNSVQIQPIVPPAQSNEQYFPPRVEGDYPQMPPPSNLYAPGWNRYYAPPLMGSRPVIPRVIPRGPPPSLPSRTPPEIAAPPRVTEGITPKLKKRVIHPSSKKYHAATLVDNPLGLTKMIPREDLGPKEAKFHSPQIWDLKHEPATPAIPPTSPPVKKPENFFTNLNTRFALANEVVEDSDDGMPDHYGVRMRLSPQTRRTGAFPLPSPSVPNSTLDEHAPSPLIAPHSNVSPIVPLRSTSNSTGGSLPSPPLLPRSISHRSFSPANILPRSALSVINPATIGPSSPKRKGGTSQPVNPPSINHTVDHDVNHTTELASQNSDPTTAAWILVSQQRHAPKRPIDVQLMGRMADLRRQTHDTSSTSSTPQEGQSLALLGSPVSIASTAFSQSFSIASPPPPVEFSPTPVFTDEIPEGFTRKLESLPIAQTPEASVHRKPHSSQNSHPPPTQSLDTIPTPKEQPIKLPASTSSVRRGYWNRRGDHLTPEGYLVFPPKSMQYPDDLKTYPLENEGYRDHSGLFTAYVRRPELPQSLPKQGKPPARPYESFVVYV